MDDENNKKDKSRRPSRVPGNAIVDVTMANNAKNELCKRPMIRETKIRESP